LVEQLLWEHQVVGSSPASPTILRKGIQMKVDLNDIKLVSPKQNAEIVKMVSEGVISSKQAKELLTIIIDMNVKEIEDFLSQHFDCCSVAQR